MEASPHPVCKCGMAQPVGQSGFHIRLNTLLRRRLWPALSFCLNRQGRGGYFPNLS
uniref:Uncharacterized protein n=1 Tax=Siphoviridae sp. ctbgC51 TaxID=2827901 RepID=A0A8S5TFU5_9CAUD|nr:MAG TPA: hypothetical protein [Siphoviridae sp. ctbgC51]